MTSKTLNNNKWNFSNLNHPDIANPHNMYQYRNIPCLALWFMECYLRQLFQKKVRATSIFQCFLKLNDLGRAK
jgi:hypothetical protein